MPDLLEYHRPRVPDRREIVLSTILGAGAGILLTVVVVGGLLVRGSPITARALLPYAMLGALLVPSARWMYWPALVSAIVQFPLYGAFCGRALGRGRFLKAFGVVVATHAAAVAAAALAYFL